MSFMDFLSRKYTVLIVEDDVMLRSTLADKFTESGYKVLETGDPHEVLKLIAEHTPDALVLDLILPIQDGISLLEDIRGSGGTLPVVILSNLLGTADLRKDADRLDATFFNKSATSLDDIVQAVRGKLS